MSVRLELQYRKAKNTDLFEDAKRLGNIDLDSAQNYYPLLSEFFSMSDANFSQVTFDNENNLTRIIGETENPNVFLCELDGVEGQLNARSFIKFSPLLDPLHHITRDSRQIDLSYQLPSLNKESNVPRLNKTNNSSYVDNFFYYLSSNLSSNICFPHATKYYGSIMGLMKNFQYNIGPDLPYLYDSESFHKNKGILFSLQDEPSGMPERQSGMQKRIGIATDALITDMTITEVTNTTGEDTNPVIHEATAVSLDTIADPERTRNKKTISPSIPVKEQLESDSSSDCSSRESETEDDEDMEDNFDLPVESEEITDDDSNSLSSDCYSCVAKLHDFPTQLISLENLEGTLDAHLIKNVDTITDEELASISIQIVMILLTYDKAFSLTHNDLHTNNVMFVSTPKKFIYYKWKTQYYRVPTFGKIYKIIDFGRSIYSFKGKVFCSDSYATWGDAATLYNFGPYYDERKPEIKPNRSFDLCRLGCSMFEYLNLGGLEPPEATDESARAMILRWVLDDAGKNMLFKRNGIERYPEFKLYKMIARKVHHHCPEVVIENPAFFRFKTIKRNLPKKPFLINVDQVPVLA